MKTFAFAALLGAASAQNLFAGVLDRADDLIHKVKKIDIDNVVNKVSDAVIDKVEDLVDRLVPEHEDVVDITTKVSKNPFGCLVEESIFPYPHVEKVIKAPLTPFHMDYSQQEAHLNSSVLRHHKLQSSNGHEPTATCADRTPDQGPNGFGEFMPVFAAQVSESSPTATY